MGRHIHYTAFEAANLLAKGKITALELIEACLSAIGDRETDVGAWAFIDPDLAIAQARACDREPRRSFIHGIPIGVKDIIDTMDMPTEYGSPIYRNHRPISDAACVAMWRSAGGIVLGKTATVEFAIRHPAKTRNPLNLQHTPGGSSSGSAAVVAAGMVPLAFGTQTGGSIIRPAAFCGVVGYKPTFGTINRAGVKPVAESLDTVGLIGRTVQDVAMAWTVFTDSDMPDLETLAAGVRRVGVCRTPYWDRLDAASKLALEEIASQLSSEGYRVVDTKMPADFGSVWEAQDRINDYETVRALSHERRRFPELLSKTLVEKLEKAEQCDFKHYLAAVKQMEDWRVRMRDVFLEYDTLLTPSAPGPAPEGLGNTGDSLFNRAWTALHVPAVTVPVARTKNNLSLGAQLVASHGNDLIALSAAHMLCRMRRGESSRESARTG